MDETRGEDSRRIKILNTGENFAVGDWRVGCAATDTVTPYNLDYAKLASRLLANDLQVKCYAA